MVRRCCKSHPWRRHRWVMVATGPGSYRNTDRVGINVKIGRHEYLYSHTKDGAPTTALTDLPRYDRPVDRIAYAASMGWRPRRSLHYRGLLVHGVDIVCQSGRHAGSSRLEHVRGDSTGRRPRLCNRRVDRRCHCDAIRPLVISSASTGDPHAGGGSSNHWRRAPAGRVRPRGRNPRGAEWSKDDSAKWKLDDPRVNFAVSARGSCYATLTRLRAIMLGIAPSPPGDAI